jgi:hypothetical protein
MEPKNAPEINTSEQTTQIINQAEKTEIKANPQQPSDQQNHAPTDPYSKVMSKKIENPHEKKENPHTLEAFGYLFMFITLYFVSAAAGMILHYSAERIFPIIGDPGSTSGGLPDIFSWFVLELIGPGFGVISPLVPYLATLIVIYPLFVFLFLWVNNRTLKDPSIRKLDIRRILLIVTVVATFAFMLYKFIYLVMNLLTGNGNMNFLSHFFITVSINLTIFLYCFYELREDKKINA